MRNARVVLDGPRLAELRIGRALTQGELAAKTGLTTRTIYRAEQGTPIRLATWRCLASALEVDLRTLTAQPVSA